MNKLCTSDQVMGALNAIMGIMKDHMAQDKEMDQKTQDLIREANKYISNVGSDMNNNFTKVINEIKNGNAKSDELIVTVKDLNELIKQLGEDGKELGDKILNRSEERR